MDSAEDCVKENPLTWRGTEVCHSYPLTPFDAKVCNYTVSLYSFIEHIFYKKSINVGKLSLVTFSNFIYEI